MHLYFPNLVCATAYELFYSRIGQHTSVGNYWNDPYHQVKCLLSIFIVLIFVAINKLNSNVFLFLQVLYFKYSQFLPFVNNERESLNTSDFKAGLTKLKQMILIGGPDDGVITPWQSSQFGYYENNETVIDMRNRSIYQTDAIGLKTLDKLKKLTIYTVPGIPHFMWHKNTTLVDLYILPHLD